jgi:hypothetical protein
MPHMFDLPPRTTRARPKASPPPSSSSSSSSSSLFSLATRARAPLKPLPLQPNQTKPNQTKPKPTDTQTFVLYIKADLENVARLTCDRARTRWCLTVKESAGSETRDGVYVSGADAHELSGSKGTANLVMKFAKGSKHEASVNVMELKVRDALFGFVLSERALQLQLLPPPTLSLSLKRDNILLPLVRPAANASVFLVSLFLKPTISSTPNKKQKNQQHRNTHPANDANNNNKQTPKRASRATSPPTTTASSSRSSRSSAAASSRSATRPRATTPGASSRAGPAPSRSRAST